MNDSLSPSRVISAVLLGMILSSFLSIPAGSHYRCYRADYGGANHDCSLHWHGHHQFWRFGNNLTDAKKDVVREGALRWNEVNSEFYFEQDPNALSIVAERYMYQNGSYPKAYAELEELGDHIVRADIYFNQHLDGLYFTGLSGCPGDKPYDAMGIGMHERGHALGLGHWPFDDEPRPTMVEGSWPKCWARTLEASDKDGMRAIYDDTSWD